MKNYKGHGVSKTEYLRQLKDRKNELQKAFNESVEQYGKFYYNSINLHYSSRDARWAYERALAESKGE